MTQRAQKEPESSTEIPTFVEQGYYSGARMGEAIDWCIVRADRELHCEVEGKLNSTGEEVKFTGRIISVKKGMLIRRIVVLVEEDLRKQARNELDTILTVGSHSTSQQDVAASQITVKNYLKRDMSDDLFYDGRELQQAVKDLEKMKKNFQIICTVWGERASDKLPIMIKGTLVGSTVRVLEPILPEGFLEVRVEPEDSVGDPKIFTIAQPQLLMGPRTNPNLTIIAKKVYIEPSTWIDAPTYRNVMECRNLTVTVKSGKKLIENVSFAMKEGEMLAIIGESGAGKSTTIKALIGDSS